MINALEHGKPEWLVPHFELEFFLSMEAFGKVHPAHRRFFQWEQMSGKERDLQRKDVAALQVETYRRFGLSGTIVNSAGMWKQEDTRLMLEHIRVISGQEFFLSIHGDATYSLPNGDRMMEFVMNLADRPDEMKDKAQANVDDALNRAQRAKEWGVLDGFCLCSDYCFNNSPFLSPAMFDEFVTPYLKQLIAGYREMGYYVIKHTDGNIMPILDALVDCNPHALHSIDPQGGVDLAEVKRLVGDKVALIGNVNCALLQTGTEEEVVADVRRALRDGMPGGGYIFGTSNCIYTGLALERYELMLDVWRKEGVYR